MAGNIKGITIEINGDTTKLDRALRDVNKETKTVQRQLSEVERALKLDPGNTDLIKQKQRLLGEELDSTKQKLQYLKEADEKVAKEMAEGTEGAAEKHDELQRQIAVTESKEKMLQRQLDKLSSVPSKVDKISAGFDKAGKKISAVSEKVTKVGEGLTKGVTVPVAAAGAASAAAWSEVDEAMDTVVKKTGASGKELEAMQKSAQNIATTVPTSFQAAGEAVGEVNTRFHLTGKELEDLSTKFVKFAEINDTDVTESVRGTQMVMSAFGMDTKDAGKMLGVLTSVSQKTGVSVDSLMSSMIANGATFRDMGLSAQNAATLLGNFEAAGIDSNTAMASLKKSMAYFQSEGIDVNKGLQDIIKSLSDGKVTTEDYNKAVEIFGKRGADAFVDMAKDGRLSLEGLSTDLDDYGSTVDDTFEGTLDPIDQAKVAFNKLKVTGAQLFTTFQSMLGPVLETLNKKLQSLNEWWSKLSPGMQQAIVKAALIAAAIGPILVGVGKIGTGIGTLVSGIGSMVSIGGKLAEGFKNIGGVAGIMGKAIGFLTSPIGMVILAIGAAIAIGVLLYKNWDKIKAVAIKVFTAVKNVITNVMNAVKGIITKVWNGIKNFFVTIFNAIKAVVTAYFKAYYTVIKTILTAIKTIVTTIWNGIRNVITTVAKAIRTAVTTVWNGIKSVTSKVFNAIKSTARSIWNGIKTAVMTPANALKSGLSSAWSAIKSTASAAWNKIKSAITSPIESAKEKVSGIIKKLKGFFPLSVGKVFSNIKLPHFNISGGKAPWGIGGKGTKPTIGIDWYAKGGIFNSPSLIGIGEAGPEAVLPIEKLQTMIDAGNLKLLDAMMSIGSNPGNGENSTLADEIVSALSRATVPIVLEVDGKVLAKVTAPFINKEISAIDRRYNRKLGTV